MLNITLFFEYFTEEHFGKDPFLVPYYLGKLLKCPVTIVYPQGSDNLKLPDEYKGVKLKPIPLRGTEKSPYRWRYLDFYIYLCRNAKKIDLLIRFFDISMSREMSMIYKMLNPNGKFYIKMDVNPLRIDMGETGSQALTKKLRGYLVSIANNYVFKAVNAISCETQLAYEKIRASKNERYNWGNKLVVMPNGFDEELLKSYNIEEKSFAEKENIMITVGRLGTYPKNTEMLLRSLSNINLGDWKFYLIGPVDDAFKTKAEAFFEENPERRKNVIFTGPIYNKKELWEYYNKSKVFVFTSEWESFGLVLVEAKRFRNYLLTTPVGAAHDILENGHFGNLLINNDDEDLAGKLQQIIDGNTKIDVYEDFDPMSLSYEYLVKIVAEKLNITNDKAK